MALCYMSRVRSSVQVPNVHTLDSNSNSLSQTVRSQKRLMKVCGRPPAVPTEAENNHQQHSDKDREQNCQHSNRNEQRPPPLLNGVLKCKAACARRQGRRRRPLRRQQLAALVCWRSR